MYAVTLFAKAPHYQAHTTPLRSLPYAPPPYADTANMVLDGGVVTLARGMGEVFMVRRFSLDSVSVLTWIGVYRHLHRAKFSQRGGSFYGAGVWTLSPGKPGKPLVALLRALADGLEPQIPQHGDIPWSVADLRLETLGLSAADREFLAGTDGAPSTGLDSAGGRRHDKYGPSIFLDLSSAPTRDLAEVLDEVFTKPGWRGYSSLYLCDDANIAEAARTGIVPVVGPDADVTATRPPSEKTPEPPPRTEEGMRSPAGIDRAAMAEMEQRLREASAEALRRHEDHYHGPAATKPRRTGKSSGTSITMLAASVMTVAATVYGGVTYLRVQEKAPQHDASGTTLQSPVPPPAPLATGTDNAAAQPQAPRAADARPRAARQEELLSRLKSIKARVEALDKVTKGANWAERDETLKAFDEGAVDIAVYLTELRDLAHGLRADQPTTPVKP